MSSSVVLGVGVVVSALVQIVVYHPSPIIKL